MNYEVVRQAIANFLQANWNLSYPLFAENVGEQQPVDQVFGRYVIRPIDAVSNVVGSNNTLGGRRVNALLWFQIFGVEAQGTTDPMKFADRICQLFDETWLQPAGGVLIKFRRGNLQYVGIEPSGRPHWKCTINMVIDDQRLATAYAAS
jgi:hypothetical protein